MLQFHVAHSTLSKELLFGTWRSLGKHKVPAVMVMWADTCVVYPGPCAETPMVLTDDETFCITNFSAFLLHLSTGAAWIRPGKNTHTCFVSLNPKCSQEDVCGSLKLSLKNTKAIGSDYGKKDKWASLYLKSILFCFNTALKFLHGTWVYPILYDSG